MSKRCGSTRRYPVRTGRSQGVVEAFDWYDDGEGTWRAAPKDPFPMPGGEIYEEHTARCSRSLGHPGLHSSILGGKPLEWEDPYDG